MTVKPILIIIVFVLSILNSYSQTDYESHKAYDDFAIIESQNRFVESLNIGTGENNSYNLPIGVKKNIGNIPFTIALSNIKFGNQYGEATLFLKMTVPQQNKVLIFGAKYVKITYSGDLVGDVKLALLSDISLSVGNMGNIILKGGFDSKTGNGISDTYISLDCNGNFIELALDAEIVLNQNTFSLADKSNTPVKSTFRTIITDWNDLLVQVSFPPMEIKGADGFIFNLKNATFDFSDVHNPTLFNPDTEYISKYMTLPDLNLWRGIYVDEFTLTLPPQFKNKNQNEQIEIGASNLIIDENGITGSIRARNVLDLENGDAGGWAFSVNDFSLALLANNIRGFGFGGEISLPISEKTQNKKYEAMISNNEYFFKVDIGEEMNFSLFGDAKLNLDPSSYLQMTLSNNKFKPKLVLNGSMSLDVDGLKMEEITFSRLTIATEAPLFSVETMEYGGEVKIHNFPITISDFYFHTKDDKAALGFDLKINLMKDKISAKSRLKLLSEYTGTAWQFKGLEMDGIRLDNVRMAGFSLNGEIAIQKDHPIYGNYFGGEIDATFDALSDAMKVKVTSVFGSKDFRYWYVEGKALFSGIGVPIGPVSLNGFTGGAYYRMSSTGKTGIEAYAPDNKSSLGVKAGVSYFIGSKIAVSGDALFEMNFLSAGGIKNIKFYGTAEFMKGIDMNGKLGKLDRMYAQAQTKKKSISNSYIADLPQNLSGSDIVRNLLPDADFKAGVRAYMLMDYDYPTKTFDADFRVMVSTPGNFLQGTGKNDEAGWAKLHCSPQSWYIHLGTPDNPIGLKLGLGPLSLKTQSYFMLGDKLEKPQAPPKEVLKILHINELQADYMKYPKNIELGKGVAFGSRMSFDTGNLSFLILYARFMAGTGFDVMLTDMSNYACEGRNKPVGLDGWYANGQCYAYLQGELGVRIKLLFIKKRIPIIKGGAAAMLQARVPNPTWIGGYLGVQFNVLGGLVKGNMKMKMSFGNNCKLVRLDGDYSPLEMPIISDLSPIDKETDVDVFISPQATFNMSVGEPFDIEDEDGNTKTYRIELEKFHIVDMQGNEIKGKIKWNNQYDVVTFESKEILPPNIDLKVSVSVNFQEYKNGRWELVLQDGKAARESRVANFKTGGAPNYIPLTNIQYCYPIIDQKNYFKGETSEGYVQLKKGQTYLFPTNFVYKAILTDKFGDEFSSRFLYDSENSRLNYTIPSVNNKTAYKLSFAATAGINTPTVPTTTTKTSSLTDEDGESFTVDYTQQAAQQIMQDGSLEVLKYSFRSSQFNTFEQKMTSLHLETGSRYVNSEVRSLLLGTKDNYELFDLPELVGTDYTENVPLVSVEASLDNKYYTEDIAPLVYNWYPIGDIKITDRDVNIYGVPPTKAFPLYEGYLNMISSGTSNTLLLKMLPHVYELPYYYNQDFYELRTKAVNSFDKGYDLQPLMPLMTKPFLFMRQGDYKTHYKYTLPGGEQGTSIWIDYSNTIDWRK